MNMRVFVVFAFLLVGLMLNGVLIALEHTPEPVEADSGYEVEDQFRDMVWSIVHGYASLLISGQKKPPENPEAAAFQMQLAFLRGFDPDTLG